VSGQHPRRDDQSQTRRALLGTLAAATTAGLAGCSADDGRSSDGTDSTTSTGTPAATGTGAQTTARTASATTAADAESVYTEVYRETSPSVVQVRTPRGSLGSGFLIRETYVVTNYHVVGEADRVSLRFSDDTSRTSRVVGTDPRSDLAVIETDPPEGAEPLELVDREPTIGTRVAVVGSPYGLRGSLSSGVVSGVDRAVPSPQGDYRIPNAIQTDAPVNPGNSGGPLVDLDGDVLGVVNSGGGENIAFAISAPLVERVVSALVEDGSYRHPTLGVDTLPVTELVASANDLSSTEGLLVVDVAERTPAADVFRPATDVAEVEGYRVPTGGDVLLSVDGEAMTSRNDLHAYVALHTSPGTTVEAEVGRDGDRETVEVEVAALPRL
jgi:S1-C subfamily serine protease